MKTIAVIFGGRSAEHDVSIVTAIGSIIKPLQLTRKYRIEAVYISKEGVWYWDERLKDISLFTSGDINDFLHRTKPLSVQFDGGMTLVKASGIAGRKTQRKIDLVFPSMHGTYGEDGSLMGLLDMANVPYVGCGTAASAVAMDKILSKIVVSEAGVPVTRFVHFKRTDLERELPRVLRETTDNLKFPVFVKPAHLGSSIGISKAGSDAELKNALEVAAHYDDKILVEEAVENLIEVTVPVMGNDDLKPALAEQPLTSPDDFFDFDTKYMKGGKKGGKQGGTKGAQGYSRLPADIPKSLYDSAVSTALDSYKALGCTGVARIDLLIDGKSKTVFFNEANPLPGSLYSHNWRAAGVSGVELVESLVQLALDRHQQRQQLTTTFNTNYLRQF
jgi:D-alanine-D-alanine ligase